MFPLKVCGVFAAVLMISFTGAEADQKCLINFGRCQDISSTCSGHYMINLCDGAYERKCCIPAFDDSKCEARTGKCQSNSVLCVGGRYLTRLCGGPTNRQCCVSEQEYNDERCVKEGGKCQNINTTCSGGSYRTGLCGRPADRRCCVPAVTEYNDERCVKEGGKCQYINTTCSGGSYLTGLCGGPADRRCCVPAVTEKRSCRIKAERLACELLDSPRVRFLDNQATMSDDKPLANLRDMCRGEQAKRSRNRCNAGCKDPGSDTVCVHIKVLEYLFVLQSTGRIVLEELTGACHQKGCKHQWGRAVDLSRDGRVMDYILTCQGMGGKVLPLADVIHCQF